MKTNIYLNRISTVQSEMKKLGFDCLIISDQYSIKYLSGIYNEPYERMYVLYLEQSGKGKLFANRLFNITENDFDVIWYSDTDDCVKLVADNILSKGCIGIDKEWPAKFLLPLMKYKRKCTFNVGSDCVDNSRACKDEEEIALMIEASRINDVCIEKGFSYIKEGITEAEVAKYIEEQFILEGASGPSFETIVSFGQNAADPHHSPDNTVIKEGDCVLIDMGCKYKGYCSDMTRTRFYKKCSELDKTIYELVRQANVRSESLVKSGIAIHTLDDEARKVIADGGYGEYFTHRLGHFIGQTDHEKGDVSSINETFTKEGMIFSIEPGIYLSGKTGVRIEDLVLVTKDGCKLLNHVDKSLKIICAD